MCIDEVVYKLPVDVLFNGSLIILAVFMVNHLTKLEIVCFNFDLFNPHLDICKYSDKIIFSTIIITCINNKN
jgi:hypothetical protein